MHFSGLEQYLDLRLSLQGFKLGKELRSYLSAPINKLFGG
jgi:hypothetical protein